MKRPPVTPTGPPAGSTPSVDGSTAAKEAQLGCGCVAMGCPVSPHAPPPLPTPSADALEAHVLRLLGPSAGDGGAGAGGLGGPRLVCGPPVRVRRGFLILIYRYGIHYIEDGQVTQQEVRPRHSVVRKQRDGQSKVVGACKVHRRVQSADADGTFYFF